MSEELQHIERIKGLIIKYLGENNLDEDECEELKNWIELSDENRKLFNEVADVNYVKDKIHGLPNPEALKEARWEQVLSVTANDESSAGPMISVKRTISWIRYIMVASMAGVLAMGAWFYVNHQAIGKTNVPVVAVTFKNDIAPGGNKAVLTLSNGSAAVLDSLGNGRIAHHGATNNVKVDNGRLAYNLLNEKPEGVRYTMLTTPATGQYQVVLPDRSKVWLNNASSLRYPVVFTGNIREVELRGEAYFEITRNTDMPFKVKTGDMMVDVLDTSFNIAAYSDVNKIKKMLLTGAVRVSKGNAKTLLKPGEQVRVTTAGSLRWMQTA